jgi:hypothetical protein
MIEKQLIQALDPFIGDLVRIEKRLAEVELKEGPRGLKGDAGEAGKDADAVEVAKSIALDAHFIDNHAQTVKALMAARFEQEWNEVNEILRS